jgi:putative nucleotidyltransferase with HDIG domain
MTVYALGGAVAARQSEISEILQRRLAGVSSALVLRPVIDSFVRRIATLSTDEERAELLSWLSEVCSSYGDVAELREVLDVLPFALAQTAHDLTECSLPREFDALESEIRDAVHAAWRPLVRVADEPLDEVDARIDTLIVRLETRDPLTSEHSRAVAAWCGRLGRRLGLEASDVTFVSRCGLLHDVGKALTPLNVLNAPRALDDKEWAVMRAHAAAGEALVRKIPELRAFAPAVRSHHERLDGRGYPDALPASAIPFAARIVAVADCFNAMIGRRPYRLPLPPTRALEELVRNRGTQFDPEMVDAMVGLIGGTKVPEWVRDGWMPGWQVSGTTLGGWSAKHGGIA